MRSTILALLLFIISGPSTQAATNKGNEIVYVQGLAETQKYLDAVADCIASVHEPEKFTKDLQNKGWQAYEEFLDDGRRLKLLGRDHIRFFRGDVQLTFSLGKDSVIFDPLLDRNTCSVSATLPKTETKQSLETKFYDRFGFNFETRGHVVSKNLAKVTITTTMTDISADYGNIFWFRVYANRSEPENRAELFARTMARPANTSELLSAMHACTLFVKYGGKDVDSRMTNMGWKEILTGQNRYNIDSAKDQETVFVKGQIMLTVYAFKTASACRLIAQLAGQDSGNQLISQAVKTFELKQPRDSSFAKRNPNISNELAKTMYENTQVNVRIKITQDKINGKIGDYINIVVAPKSDLS